VDPPEQDPADSLARPKTEADLSRKNYRLGLLGINVASFLFLGPNTIEMVAPLLCFFGIARWNKLSLANFKNTTCSQLLHSHPCCDTK